nr:MAG TPA: hypothetical protein [Caudoviricetes sp.]
MNEEEREIVKKFERLYLKDFNNEKITNEDRLSYIECALITNLIEKLQKENEELKNKLLDTLEGQKVIEEETPQYIKENFIPVQKVKDKIEEINKKILNAPKYDEKISVYRYQKQILQELIGESEEK